MEIVSNWEDQFDAPALKPGVVHVWRFTLLPPGELLALLEGVLSQDELARASRLRFPQLRTKFVAAHGCLRDILGRYLKVPAGEVQFIADEFGKPSLVGDQEIAGLSFNLSHSENLGLLAVGDGRKIGIDLEYIKPGADYEALVRRYFSPSEVADYFELPKDQRVNAFYTCWTRKEAFIKAVGQGLTMPLDQFDVSLIPGELPLLRHTRPDPAQALQWKLYDLFPKESYAAALAVQAPDIEIQGWQWLARS